MMIKIFSFCRLWKTSILLLIIIIMTDCGGMVRKEYYAPIAPELEEGAVKQISHKIARSEKPLRASFNTGDATLMVYPVDLSEKMTMLFGPLIILPTPLAEKTIYDKPLSINVKIDIQQGTASFNSQDCVVLLGENRRMLRPTSVTKHIYRPGEPKSESEEVSGTVTLDKQPEALFYFKFTYDILKTNLPPFVFHFSSLNINGRAVSFQELPFEKTSHYWSR